MKQILELIGIPSIPFTIGFRVAKRNPGLEFELEVNSIPEFANGIGIDGFVPMTAELL